MYVHVYAHVHVYVSIIMSYSGVPAHEPPALFSQQLVLPRVPAGHSRQAFSSSSHTMWCCDVLCCAVLCCAAVHCSSLLCHYAITGEA